MHHRPYKKTEILRQTLVQEARVFVPPELDAPPGSFRKVQLLLPASPAVVIGLDTTPEQLGLNRGAYKLPELPAGPMITFHLLPDQFIVGAATVGYAKVSVVVEYLGGE